MDLDKLRVFHEAAAAGSFTRAGERLHLSQPSVSGHVRDLERVLGVPLFERLGRGVRLTGPGAALYEYAKRIFALESDAESELAAFRGAEAGEVTLAASSTPGVYLLPPILAPFRAAHPGVKLAVHISDTGDVTRHLEDLSADIGVVGAPIAGMENHAWRPDELVLVAGRDHPWRAAPPLNARELDGSPFISREAGSSVGEATKQWLSDNGIRVDVVLTLEGTEAVKRAVAAGLGITITTSYALGSELETGELAVVDVPGLPIRRNLYLSRDPRRPLVPAARALWDALCDTSATG
ncbi:MAG: LysR substrate-binding domain-containing protein [Candidatus Binatia bacterium]